MRKPKGTWEMTAPVCADCLYGIIRDGEPDPVCCPKCDGDNWVESAGKPGTREGGE